MIKNLTTMLAIGVSIAAISAPAHAQAIDYNIAAGSLESALDAYARQPGPPIVYKADEVRNARSPGVQGALSPRAALDALLAGSGYAARPDASGAVAIERQNALPQGETDAGSAAAVYESADIIVTAQRRGESLQDVPISMAVLSGEELDRSPVQGVSEALSRVPGVSVGYNAQGGGTMLSVRGVTNLPLFVGSSPIGYYIDSVPFGFSRHAVAPDASAYDLSRVEVLRGPQGTLYGAGGMGGVVRVLTHDADVGGFDFKGRASVSDTKGGEASWRSDMAVNMPVIEDKLAVRAVLGYNDAGGWIESPSDRNINDAQLANFRVRLRAQPTDRLSIALYSWISRSKYDALALSNDDEMFNSDLAQPTSTNFETYGINIGYEFSSFTINSSTSYINFRNKTDQDISFLAPLRLLTELDARLFSEELVLNSAVAGSPWEWTAGFFYRDEKSRTLQPLIFIETGDEVVNQDVENTSTQIAIFGELSRWLVQDRLKLSGGLRYFHAKEKNTGEYFGGPLVGLQAAKYKKLTPRAVLTWLPNDNLTFYASYAQGFRSGQISLDGVDAQPDLINNYEVGAKGDLLDGRISFEAALYYTDWKNIQQQVTRSCPDRTGTIPLTICSAIDNAGSANGLGVDLGLSVRPVDRLTLGLNFSWNDLTYAHDVFGATGLLEYSAGRRIQLSPEYTANTSADYAFPLGGNGLKGRVSGSANYTSKRISGTIFPGGPATSEPLLIANLSFSIETPNHWVVTFFAENVNNEKDAVFVGLTPEWGQRIRPRTIGLQLEYRY